MSGLDEKQVTILEALSRMEDPAGCKDIGEEAGIPWRTVMGKLRGLKKGGYVETPVKSKYVITEKGRETIG
jgi:predicted transcriptional regulator